MKKLNRILIALLTVPFLLGITAYSQSAPNFSYQDQLKQYDNGKKDPAFVRSLARMARNGGDKANAARISGDYIANIRDIFTKDNLQFLSEFTQSSKEPSFNVFYRNAAKVDRVIGRKGFAEDFVESVIVKEEIVPLLFPGDKPRAKDDLWKPDWENLTATITRKYDAAYADRVSDRAKVWWYQSREEWPPEYFKSLLVVVQRYLERQPDLTNLIPTLFEVNNPAWYVFAHSTDKAELNAAISWMERVLRQNTKDDLDRAFYMDTYANLLYKMGRKDEAVKWEEAALNIATGTKRRSEEKIKLYEPIVEKMKKGVPTWPLK
jgi:tetratricopeptide (TPR) repeat protein